MWGQWQTSVPFRGQLLPFVHQLNINYLTHSSFVSIEADWCLLLNILCIFFKKEKKQGKGERVSYQFISHSIFLPKKIISLNPWWIWGAEAEQSAGAALKCAPFHPFSSSAVEAEKKLQRQALCCSCQWGWVIPIS